MLYISLEAQQEMGNNSNWVIVTRPLIKLLAKVWRGLGNQVGWCSALGPVMVEIIVTLKSKWVY